MAGKVTGRAFVKLNGQLQQTRNGATLDPGGMVRTAVIGVSGVVGYTEEPRQSSVECTLIHASQTDLLALRDLAGVTVEFEADTGQKWVIADAWLTEPPRLTSNSGDVALKFEGPPAVNG